MALALVSSDPADTATGVSTEQVITLTFNETVRVKSATSGTVQLYRDDSDLPLEAEVVASGKRILLLPAAALHQNALYRIKVVGSDLGLGYALQSADATFLAATLELTFRTGTERYVSLTEIAGREDIERIGPIRETDPLAIQPTAGTLALESVDPEAFASKVSIDTTAVTLTFDRDIDPATVDASTVQITQVPALGLEEYYGIQTTGSDGEVICRLGVQLADDELPLTPPTLALTVVGNQILALRDPLTPFLFNTEVRVKVTTGVQGTDGSTLAANAFYVFTTEYLPMYSSLELIQMKMGPLVSTLTDDTICRILHKYSLDAWEDMNRSISLKRPVDQMVTNWVTCKTIIDILNVLMAESDLRAGQKKTLGDLTIQHSPTDPKLNALYNSALQCIEDNPIFDTDSMLAKVAVKGRAAPGERGDHRMRTWDYLLLQSIPGANLGSERFEKARLSAPWAFAGKDHQFFVSLANTNVLVGDT